MQFSNTCSVIALLLCRVVEVQRAHLPEHVKMSMEQRLSSRVVLSHEIYHRFKNSFGDYTSSNLFTVDLHLREVFSTSGSSVLGGRLMTTLPRQVCPPPSHTEPSSTMTDESRLLNPHIEETPSSIRKTAFLLLFHDQT